MTLTDPTTVRTPALPSSAPRGNSARPDMHSAHNYRPLPLVISEAQSAWVTDVNGKRCPG